MPVWAVEYHIRGVQHIKATTASVAEEQLLEILVQQQRVSEDEVVTAKAGPAEAGK